MPAAGRPKFSASVLWAGGQAIGGASGRTSPFLGRPRFLGKREPAWVAGLAHGRFATFNGGGIAADMTHDFGLPVARTNRVTARAVGPQAKTAKAREKVTPPAGPPRFPTAQPAHRPGL